MRCPGSATPSGSCTSRSACSACRSQPPRCPRSRATRRTAIRRGCGSTIADALRLMLMLIVPALVGLIVLAEPIIRVIFERGSFAPADTVATAAALTFYAPGLLGYSAVRIAVPCFYALRDSVTPTLVSVTAVLLNLVLNLHAGAVDGLPRAGARHVHRRPRQRRAAVLRAQPSARRDRRRQRCWERSWKIAVAAGLMGAVGRGRSRAGWRPSWPQNRTAARARAPDRQRRPRVWRC